MATIATKAFETDDNRINRRIRRHLNAPVYHGISLAPLEPIKVARPRTCRGELAVFGQLPNAGFAGEHW